MPSDPELPEMLFRQGRLYYDYQVYDPAVRQWGLLLEKHPNSSYARGAGELILDSFNKSQDYQNIDLPAHIDSDRGRQLIGMVDPYSYRASLVQPKMILLGTNDRYWPLDALSLYWRGLEEPESPRQEAG